MGKFRPVGMISREVMRAHFFRQEVALSALLEQLYQTICANTREASGLLLYTGRSSQGRGTPEHRSPSSSGSASVSRTTPTDSSRLYDQRMCFPIVDVHNIVRIQAMLSFA